MREYCLIQGYPCPLSIAPYIAIVVKEANAIVYGIYRADDAKELLIAHGHYTQDRIFKSTSEQRTKWGVATDSLNPSGCSTHELFSDGVAYPDISRGNPLEEWQVGFGVRAEDSDRIIAAGAHHGWTLFRPYYEPIPSTGDMIGDKSRAFHHMNFKSQPYADNDIQWRQIQELRDTLPRS